MLIFQALKKDLARQEKESSSCDGLRACTRSIEHSRSDVRVHKMFGGRLQQRAHMTSSHADRGKLTYRRFYHPCPLEVLSTEAAGGTVPGVAPSSNRAEVGGWVAGKGRAGRVLAAPRLTVGDPGVPSWAPSPACSQEFLRKVQRGVW